MRAKPAIHKRVPRKSASRPRLQPPRKKRSPPKRAPVKPRIKAPARRTPTPLYSARPSRWVSQVGAQSPIAADPARASDYLAAKRREVIDNVRRALQGEAGSPDIVGTDGRIPGLRAVYQGFTAERGFDLRKVERWPKRRLEQVLEAARELRYLASTPFKIVKPKNKKQKRTLQHFTLQAHPRQKQYIVHVETPNYQVEFSTDEGLQIRKGRYKARLWLFADYNNDEQPSTQNEFIEATQRMLPDMPDWGYFSLWSSSTGVIGAPQPKESLIRALLQYFAEGDSFSPEKFDEIMDILQGWILQGDEEEAERVRQARQKRRAARNKWKEKQRKRRRRLLGLNK